MTARFDHFSLAVRDLTTSRYFYGVQLGLVERARPDLGFPGVWYDLGAGQTLHLLGQSNTDEDHDVSTFPGAAAGRQSHLALRVVDWAGRLEALEAAGCMIQPSKSGRRAAFVADPDQHWVELIEAG
ncbi:MAG: VOC family protein [Thioalkalivibrionaceae bacterium]